MQYIDTKLAFQYLWEKTFKKRELAIMICKKKNAIGTEKEIKDCILEFNNDLDLMEKYLSNI